MTTRILIIGGYGNFGSFIARRLSSHPNIQLIIAGRNIDKANTFAASLIAENPPETARLDIHSEFTASLTTINPDIVIHTSGPFQSQGYQVAKACIELGCHYIDLADGRDFVAGIVELDEAASANAVLVISGASSVPCLTAALVDDYMPGFDTLQTLNYGITTAQKTNRGLATTRAILGYVGQSFDTMMNGSMTKVYGWQDLHTRNYRQLGTRMLGNCDVPDLSLFPNRYPDLKTIRFYAGLEISFIHLILWSMSGLVRIGLIKNLQRLAPILLRLSFLFDWAGTANSGFYMELSGKAHNGDDKTVTFELVARQGDGPYIPCTPAILLAKKLAEGTLTKTGAYPCIGFISKREYLQALSDLAISWVEY